MASHAPREVGPPILLASTTYDHVIDRIQLSPDGMHYVAKLRSADDPEGDRAAQFVLGTRYGPPVPLGKGLSAGFLSNSLVAIYEVGAGQQVRVVTLDGHVELTTSMPALADDATFFTDTGEWKIFGVHARKYLRVQKSSLEPVEWALRPMVREVVDVGPLLVFTAWDATPLATSIAGATSEVVRVGEGDKDHDVAHTLLDIQLQRIPGDTSNVLCFSHDESRTHVSLLDATTRRLTPLAWLPGVISQAAVAPDRRVVMRSSFGDVVLFNPRNDVVSIVDTSEVDDPSDIAIGDHAVVVVQWTAHGSQIMFYSTSTIE